jgi:hypothetical protein
MDILRPEYGTLHPSERTLKFDQQQKIWEGYASLYLWSAIFITAVNILLIVQSLFGLRVMHTRPWYPPHLLMW